MVDDKSVEKSVMPGLNGGTLRRGGNTTPGTGRPKSVIREKCAGSFEQRIKVAEEILDDPNSTNADKIRALDLLGKYAGLQQTDITTNDQAVKPVVLDVSSLGMELIDEILAKENMHTE